MDYVGGALKGNKKKERNLWLLSIIKFSKSLESRSFIEKHYA
jgi:hypothetical protein